jgi:AcrR family transcriptional regulator
MATNESIEPVSRRDRPAKAPLNRALIVDAALALAEHDGVGSVTLRRVAERLDTGPASLYVYVTNRAELLNRMLERALADVPATAVKSKRWRRRLVELYSTILEALERYPGLAQVALEQTPAGGRGAQPITENALGLMRAGEVQGESAEWGCDALMLYTLATAAQRSGRSRQVAGGGDDAASTAIDEGSRFVFGLLALIQGIRGA